MTSVRDVLVTRVFTGCPSWQAKKLEKAPLHGSDTLLYAMWAEG